MSNYTKIADKKRKVLADREQEFENNFYTIPYHKELAVLKPILLKGVLQAISDGFDEGVKAMEEA
jgi:hypothetical protein